MYKLNYIKMMTFFQIFKVINKDYKWDDVNVYT